MLAGLWLATALVRIWLNRFIGGPTIFADELQYVEMGRSFDFTSGLPWSGVPTHFPAWLYPMLTSVFLKNMAMEAAHPAILQLNAALMALTVIPAYFLAREVGSRRRALAAAGLVALIPGMGYSGMVMPESLFFPIFTTALWLGYRALERPTVSNRLLAGAIFGLAFHVKPQGMFLPVIFFLTVIVSEILRLMDIEDWKAHAVDSMKSVARHGVTAAAWFGVVAIRFAEIALVERASEAAEPSSQLAGSASVLAQYSIVAQGGYTLDTHLFLGKLMFLFGVWIGISGILPALVLIRESVATVSGRRSRRLALLTTLTCTTTLFLIAFFARYLVVHRMEYRVLERYLFIGLPPILILFCTSIAPGTNSWRRRAAYGVVIILMAMFWFRAAVPVRWDLAGDSPSMAGMLLILRRHDLPFPIGWGCLALGLATLIGLVGAPRTPVGQGAAVAALLIYFNFGWYANHAAIAKPLTEGERRIAEEIDEKVPEGHKLLVLHEGLNSRTANQVLFRNPGLNVRLGRRDLNWFSQRLELGDDGAVNTPYEPGSTWLLAGPAWRFNKNAVRYFDGCALYRVGGREPLAIDMEQVAAHRSGRRPIEEQPTGPNVEDLEMTYLSVELPAYWKANRRSLIKLAVVSEVVFETFGGRVRLAVGYHWSDPNRTGSWEAIVWDDGSYAYLPEGLQPGQEAEVELIVRAPDKAGEEWLLTLSALAVDQAYQTRTWAPPSTHHPVWVEVVP